MSDVASPMSQGWWLFHGKRAVSSSPRSFSNTMLMALVITIAMHQTFAPEPREHEYFAFLHSVVLLDTEIDETPSTVGPQSKVGALINRLPWFLRNMKHPGMAGPALSCCKPSIHWLIRMIWLSYTIQFIRHPPRYSRVLFTSVRGEDFVVLWVEIAVLYSSYFIIPKKGSGLRSILDLHILNQPLYKLSFKIMKHMLSSDRHQD